MSRNLRELCVNCELLEFDLDLILDYARMHHDALPSQKPSVSKDLSNLLPVIDRTLNCESPAPFILDETNLRLFLAGCLTKEGTDTYTFATDAFEVKAGANGLPILSLHNKARGTLRKQKTMISYNFLDTEERNIIFNEIRFITHRLKKCGPSFCLPMFRLTFSFKLDRQLITTKLDYQLLIYPSFERYFSSDVTTPLIDILKQDVIPYPADDDIFYRSYDKTPIDTHLFYKVITDNTARMPGETRTFHHPRLLTNLLPFQRKTVGWLLDKEGVTYENDTKSTFQKPLISPEYEKCLELYPDVDLPWFDEVTNDILNRLCFGWNRVLFRDQVCWLNEFTGNIIKREQVVDYLRNSIEPLQRCLPARGLLSEEMGLGKTVEVVNMIFLNQRSSEEVGKEVKLQLQQEGDIRAVKVAKTTLIAAPQPILHQWYNEIVRFCPALSVTIYRGVGKYPEFLNIPRYIGEFLRRFDVVLLNYSQLAAEANHAKYSSRHAATRGKKRSLAEVNEDYVPQETPASNVSAFQATFDIPNQDSSQAKGPKQYENEVTEELASRARRERLDKIPHTQFYESPLMQSQWWRVILDEVQMVSSGASNAFSTASLIPRFHSWGVSGTPARLPAVLQYLRYPPFNFESSKFCWKKIDDPVPSNADFVKVWLGLALRHTKAMVDDQISLPPQRRILLTIPFTDVEQDKYNQMYESCLASIGIRLDKYHNPTRTHLSPSDCVHLRSWLGKLQQLCGNLQIGNLSTKKGGRSKKSNLFISGFAELKTLSSVLSEMMESTIDEISEGERAVIGRMLDIAQLLEFVFLPEKVIQLLNKGLAEINCLMKVLRKQDTEAMTKLTSTKDQLLKLHLLKKKDFADLYDERLNGEENFDNVTNVIDTREVINENDAQGALSSFTKLKESINQRKSKMRALKMLQHKCYFLLASAHFQMYDEEYQMKILSQRVHFSSLSTIENNVIRVKILDSLNSVDEHQLQQEFLADFTPPEGLSLEDEKTERHKFLESKFYGLAEECRESILKHTIKEAQQVTVKNITGKGFIFEQDWKNDGSKILPKSNRKLVMTMPRIEIEDLKSFIGNSKVKEILTQVSHLIHELNLQADYIRALIENLQLVLCNPLMSDERNPNGSEYGKSLDDQEQASMLMLVITQLLIDRSNATIEQKAKIDEVRKNQEKDLRVEARRISDRVLLRQLQENMKKLKPQSKYSFEELLQDTRIIQNELDGSNSAQASLFQDICDILRVVFENEKNSQEVLHKEMNSYNAVFNARVEYFKQLQQISDSVEAKHYATTQDDLQAMIIDAETSTLMIQFAAAKRKLTKGVSKFRYLSTLISKGDEEEGEQKNRQDECVICQSLISVGSLTPCGHKFCKACLDEWLKAHSACPICKSYTTQDTVYHFTQHKSELKAELVANGTHDGTHHTANSSIHSVYSQLDDTTLRKIHQIRLSNSFGSKVDLIVKQVLYLKSLNPEVQIVVFSQWQDLLAILTFAFDKAGISHVSAKGSHIAALKKKLEDPVEKFKNSGITCFLLNSQAQASGLTLINATHIFLCEPLVNTAVELQAISRVHRIGQIHATTVWMFAIRNSVEENIVALGTRNRIEYLKANQKENKANNKKQKLEILSSEPLKQNELLKAESYAMSLGMTSEKSSSRMLSGNTASVADSDLPFVYFGEK